MKDHIVEIIVIILAIAILGFVWNNQKNKPEPETPSINSQVQQAQ